jgi:hypothetical protein
LADFFIIVLTSVILFLIGSRFCYLHDDSRSFDNMRVTINGTVEDVILGASDSLSLPLVSKQTRSNFFKRAVNNVYMNSWDKALLAIHAAESGDLVTGSTLLKNVSGVDGNAFQRTWNFSYCDIGQPPSESELRSVQRALGHSYAALILEARLVAKIGGNQSSLEMKARSLVLVRVLYFGVLCALLTIVSLLFIIYLGVRRACLINLPCLGFSGRVLVIVLLGWFLTMLVSNDLIKVITNIVPDLKPASLNCIILSSCFSWNDLHLFG